LINCKISSLISLFSLSDALSGAHDGAELNSLYCGAWVVSIYFPSFSCKQRCKILDAQVWFTFLCCTYDMWACSLGGITLLHSWGGFPNSTSGRRTLMMARRLGYSVFLSQQNSCSRLNSRKSHQPNSLILPSEPCKWFGVGDEGDKYFVLDVSRVCNYVAHCVAD